MNRLGFHTGLRDATFFPGAGAAVVYGARLRSGYDGGAPRLALALSFDESVCFAAERGFDAFATSLIALAVAPVLVWMAAFADFT